MGTRENEGKDEVVVGEPGIEHWSGRNSQEHGLVLRHNNRSPCGRQPAVQMAGKVSSKGNKRETCFPLRSGGGS